MNPKIFIYLAIFGAITATMFGIYNAGVNAGINETESKSQRAILDLNKQHNEKLIEFRQEEEKRWQAEKQTILEALANETLLRNNIDELQENISSVVVNSCTDIGGDAFKLYNRAICTANGNCNQP